MLLAVVFACSCEEKKEQAAKAPVRVTTETLSSSAGVGGKTYVGIIEEREATAVSFTGMGVVKRVLVSEGQTVAKGQLIAEMDDTQARNMLATAEAQMTQADDAQQRYGMLHDAGSMPEAKWVEVQSKVAQARAQLEVARKNLADCQLRAPVGGIIGKKQIGAGETALPSQAVVTIFDISTVKVKVAIPETEIATIGPHTASTIYVEAAQKTTAGGTIEKGVVADALSHTYDIRISAPNGDRRLLPGMVAAVTFAATDKQTAELLTLPVTAVQRRADGTLFTWTVADDGTAHRTTVTIGHTIGNRVVIASGLEGGQRVITEGYQKLSEGTKVLVP